ncbi:hypothetical protein [Paenibacillus sp. GYB003]|uniref:hypothetical protein n=1 Tax=Paenibacillus sp. GYB003 TaxID=2994392 RepID=UPI002F960F63
MKPASVNTFQMKIPDEINRQIKADASLHGISKHDWILKAIMQQLERNDKAV